MTLFNNIEYFFKNRHKAIDYFIQDLKANEDNVQCIFQHFFGWIEDKKWFPIITLVSNSTKINKYKIRFYPSGLFTKQETIQYIIKVLSSNVFMLNLFIAILIEEKERNYWVDVIPPLILLSMLKNNNIKDDDSICNVIITMYKTNSSIFDKLVASEVNKEIKKSLNYCYKNFDNLDEIEKLISQNIFDNFTFQSRHTKWKIFSFTSKTCFFDKTTIRWSQLKELKIRREFQELEFIYRNGFHGVSTSYKMKSIVDCENAYLIFSVQLDMMKEYHCKDIVTYNSKASLTEHWKICRLLHDSSSLNIDKISQSDYFHPPNVESIGNNCYINIVSIKVETIGINHVCIKKLYKIDKSKKFWKMILSYSQWRHPNILEFHGIIDGKFAIFRECAESPLITYLVKETNDPFTFADLLQVLTEIGSALHYLHDNLGQYHGNVTLQRIMKVGQCYKLCEPSLDKRIVENYQCLSDLGDNINLENCSEQTHDLWQLLYSIVALFYINPDMYQQQISRSSFNNSHCNPTMKNLLIKWLSEHHGMDGLMKDLVATEFSQDDTSLVLVQPKNELVPEFLKIVARDANMFEVIKINFSELKLIKEIGKGHFSKVYKAEWQQSPNKSVPVAVKEIREKNLKSVTLLRELRPSTIVSHRNVLKSIGFSQNESTMYVVTELGECSLLTYLKENRQQISNEDCLDFCIQICEGMQFMSDEYKIIHRDLATRNVIVFRHSNGHLLKISDFGLTVLLRDKKDYYTCDEIANELWLPEEDIKEKKYSQKTDIYSYGVVMWEIFSRGVGTPEKKLPMPANICQEGYDIIQKCHSAKAKNRPENFGIIRALLEDLR